MSSQKGTKVTKLPVLNLLGGPGCGKSTTAALIFGRLKQLGYNAELCNEYAKSVVWRKATNILGDQLYILAKQYHKLYALQGQCDIAITDSPVVLSLTYNELSPNPLTCLEPICLEVFNRCENFNYVIKRSKAYNPIGRNQTEEEAKELDVDIESRLQKLNIPYKEIPYGDEGVLMVIQDFIKWFGSQPAQPVKSDKAETKVVTDDWAFIDLNTGIRHEKAYVDGKYSGYKALQGMLFPVVILDRTFVAGLPEASSDYFCFRNFVNKIGSNVEAVLNGIAYNIKNKDFFEPDDLIVYDFANNIECPHLIK